MIEAGPSLGQVGEVLHQFLIGLSAQNLQPGQAHSLGFYRAVDQFLHQADAVGLSATLLCSAAKKRPLTPPNAATSPRALEAQGQRLALLARLWAAHGTARARAGVATGTPSVPGNRRAGQHLLWAQQPDPTDAEPITVQNLHLSLLLPLDWSYPVWFWHLDRLAQGLRRVQVTLLSADDRPPLEQALKPLWAAMYRRDNSPIELAQTDSLGPNDRDGLVWARFVRSLFRPRAAGSLVQPGEMSEPQVAARLTFHPAAKPLHEAQAVARKVQALLSSGVSASDISVIAETPKRRERLRQALAQAGIAVANRAPVSPLEWPAPLRLIELLFENLALGLPREGFIHLLCSRYLQFPGPLAEQPWLVAQSLRAAGVRYVRHPRKATQAQAQAPKPTTPGLWQDEPADGETATARLAGWLAKQTREPASRTRAFAWSKVVPQLELASHELDTLPERAPISEHCRSLLRLLNRLGFFHRCAHFPALPVDSEPTCGHVLVSLLSAREQDVAAAGLVRLALTQLPLWCKRLGQASAPVSQNRFAGLLRLLFSRLWDGLSAGPNPHVVELGGLSDFVQSPRKHALLTGLIEGELPGFVPEDPLLPDEDRRWLEQLAGRELFEKSHERNDAAPLLLAVALAHTENVHLFWSLTDEEGRPLARSPWVAEVRFAAALEPETKDAQMSHGAQTPFHLDELWAKAASEPALWELLKTREKRRADRLSALWNIEIERRRFWAQNQGQNQGHPFVGQVLDASLLSELAPRLPGSAQRPLSVSVLEDYARCPFRFFARRVLGLRPTQETGEDMDALVSGRLHHLVLEAFYKDRLQKQRLPVRADDEDRAAFYRVLQTTVADFAAREHYGHPALLRVRVARLRRELWRLFCHEAQNPPDRDCVPALFECKFGPVAIAAVHNDGDSPPLHIHGVIDRIDLQYDRAALAGDAATACLEAQPGEQPDEQPDVLVSALARSGRKPRKALVLDYKAGRLDHYEKQLRDNLLVTSFQLPLYVAAVRSALQTGPVVADVQARYYSLREGKVSADKYAISDPDQTTFDPVVRLRNPEKNVAEVAYRLWTQLCSGHFVVLPKTCEGCGLESVCRIASAPRGETIDRTDTTQPGGASNETASSTSTATATATDEEIP